jgi:tetratricopeptide (TPR) repeat protein
VGEPGIGKTRLAHELATEARRCGVAVHWGRCWEGGGAPAYWPWIEIVRACLRGADTAALAERAGPEVADVALIVPELRQHMPRVPEPKPVADPERARFHLFDATAALLRAAAVERPLVLVLEDLHAADRPSLLLLQFVARELRDAPVLLVGCYRELEVRQAPELAGVLAEIAREAHSVPLRGLGEDDVGRFIEASYARPAAGAVVRAVHRATEGNPFFVDGVVRLLSADGRLDRADWVAGERLPIPDGVRETIRRRLRPLDGDCAALLALAAVMGHEFDLACLGRAAGRPVRTIIDALGAAVAAGVVAERPPVLGRYRFSHALIRETVYESLAPAERAELHRRIGEALEALHGGDRQAHVAELAHHFFLAAPGGGIDKAVDYCRRAAEQAARELAGEEAVGRYERALQALSLGGPADARRCELLLALGEAQEQVGDFARARHTFGEAAAIARRLGDRDALARAALGPGGQWALKLTSSIFEKSDVPLLEEALGVVPAGDGALRSRLLARLGLSLCFAGTSERGEVFSREGVDMARRVGDVPALAHALSARHAVLLAPEHLEARLGVASEVVRLAQETGDLELALRGHILRMYDLSELGEIAAAELETARYWRIVEEVRDPFEQWFGTMVAAGAALFHGRIAESEQLAFEALAIARRVPGQHAAEENARTCFVLQLGLIRREQRRIAEIEPEVRRFVEAYPYVPAWRAFQALVNHDLGREGEVRRDLDALSVDGIATIRRDSVWMGCICFLAEVAAVVGDAARAARLFDLLAPFRGRNAQATSPARFGSVARYLGFLAATGERWAEAEEAFEAALAMNARMGATLWLAHTQVDYAAMLVRRGGAGDRERAAELLDRAGTAARDIGSARLDERIAGLAHDHDVAGRGGGAADSRPATGGSPSVFRREGEYWTIAYDGRVCRLKDTRGVGYLVQLLRHPGREFHAAELLALASAPEVDRALSASRMRDDEAAEMGLHAARPGESDAAVDPKARAAYRRRLAELREELEEARAHFDIGRARRAREEIDALTSELSATLGFGGRRPGSDAERARLKVTKAIKGVLARISATHPALARHLTRSVRTGTFCCYAQESVTPIVWSF